MKLHTVLSVLKQITYLKSIVKDYGDSLAQGKYYLFDIFRAMSLNEPDTLKSSSRYFNMTGVDPNKARVAAILNKTGYFTNKNKKTKGDYVAFYTANNYDLQREVKLFSFENKKILTICTSQTEMEKQLQQFRAFGACYNMPQVLKCNRYPNSLELSMVDLLTPPEEYFALKNIAESTVQGKSLSATDLKSLKGYELVSFNYENEKINDILKKIVSEIDKSVLESNIFLSTQHGDLSKDNLIYGTSNDKTDFWYIDWEHASERIFFYDYFFYMINSALYYDDSAFKCYMKGESDDILTSFFKQFDLEFNPEFKKDYFLLFTVVFLKERVCDFGRTEALEMYYDFIKKSVL